jgi:NAD(P)-dependent dehydrogenase (short-subunit alcohol dehydrogenase family)
MNAIDLYSRVALLTGGRGGIGWAISERSRVSGAVAWDLADHADGRVEVIDEAAITAGVEQLLARTGGSTSW